MVPVHVFERPMPYRRYIQYADLLRKHRSENIVFCEHRPTITLGIQTKPESLLTEPASLSKQGVEVVAVKRGGDATAHEPGQIIVYPHIDLKQRQIKLSDFVSGIIDITGRVIESMFQLKLVPNPDAPGLYNTDGEKVVSMGIEIKKAFSSSGIAINYTNDLNTFSFIHPCGYHDLKMASIYPGQSVEKKNDPKLQTKKKEFCKLWAGQFIQLFSLY